MTPIEIVLLILSLILGYLIGTINPGYIIGRIKGIDIREVGTKNPGTSNLWHTLGKKYGILTAAYDIFKSLIACIISIYILGLNYYLAQFSGIIAIIGHRFPFYLKFRGGKGVATAIGMLPYYVSMYMSTTDPYDFTMIYLVLFLLPISLLFIYITHLLSMLAWIMFPILGYACYLYYPGNEFNIFFLLVLIFLVEFVTYSAVINKKFPLKDKIFKKDWIRMILRLLSIFFLIFYDVISKAISLGKTSAVIKNATKKMLIDENFLVSSFLYKDFESFIPSLSDCLQVILRKSRDINTIANNSIIHNEISLENTS